MMEHDKTIVGVRLEQRRADYKKVGAANSMENLVYEDFSSTRYLSKEEEYGVRVEAKMDIETCVKTFLCDTLFHLRNGYNWIITDVWQTEDFGLAFDLVTKETWLDFDVAVKHHLLYKDEIDGALRGVYVRQGINVDMERCIKVNCILEVKEFFKELDKLHLVREQGAVVEFG